MSEEMNLFEFAARNSVRFASTRGQLNVEQLWQQVPLRSQDDFNLDAIAKAAEKSFLASERSFVNTKKTAEQKKLEVAFEIVKYVIDVKLKEEAAAKKRADSKAERDMLHRALLEKQEGKLSKMSEAELRRRIDELDE